jgi:hypothetical protein
MRWKPTRRNLNLGADLWIMVSQCGFTLQALSSARRFRHGHHGIELEELARQVADACIPFGHRVISPP